MTAAMTQEFTKQPVEVEEARPEGAAEVPQIEIVLKVENSK